MTTNETLFFRDPAAVEALRAPFCRSLSRSAGNRESCSCVRPLLHRPGSVQPRHASAGDGTHGLGSPHQRDRLEPQGSRAGRGGPVPAARSQSRASRTVRAKVLQALWLGMADIRSRAQNDFFRTVRSSRLTCATRRLRCCPLPKVLIYFDLGARIRIVGQIRRALRDDGFRCLAAPKTCERERRF